MKVLTRILAVAVAFSGLSGGAYLFASNRSDAPAVGIIDPVETPPSETPGQPVAPPSAPSTPEPSAQADPPAPPADPEPSTGKRIEVSIKDQELIAWHDGVVVYRFKISTGRPGYETPTGRFRIHTKYDLRWSRTWNVWMPYAMFWHPRWGYAFHELPYKPGSPNKRIGASKLGRADSHGCVRVNIGDAKLLYDWAPVGTSVWIH